MNLLKETKDILLKHNHTLKDIVFVCDCLTNTRIPIYGFIANANFNYDNGYGLQEINMNLLLVGKDFWLERHEYDGAEWWEYKQLPKIEDYVEGKVNLGTYQGNDIG